ncbi:MAG TPA: prephenate dehydrogenase [Elusimicrobiota bacterium]|nr:prephenate dehydrogenase [Elusimicrobiota bacterium]
MRKTERIAIVGVGLMGGSLGLALRRADSSSRLIGIGRHPGRLKKARLHGAIHEWTTDLVAGVRGADIVVLCAPVDDVLPLLRRIAPALKPECLVMDVGSVKGEISLKAAKVVASFVGTHPMAGSEKTGVAHAKAGLYRGAVCVLTPTGRTPKKAVLKAQRFWRRVGARPLILRPEVHDRWVAFISHLPHLAAHSLMLTARRVSGGDPRFWSLAAGSFKDMTRVAEADPRQWNAIFRMNKKEVMNASRLFRSVMTDLERKGWPVSELSRAQHARRRLGRSH